MPRSHSAPAAGFVLAGGASRRMGRDKALLFDADGLPLLARAAAAVAAVTDGCHIVAPPGRYEALGFPVIADRWPGEGPLGGILTALDASAAELSLIVAVDMPFLDSAILERLLAAGRTAIARGDRLHPLCAVYHRSALPALQAFFDGGGRRVLSAIETIPYEPIDVAKHSVTNINTPADWEAARS